MMFLRCEKCNKLQEFDESNSKIADMFANSSTVLCPECGSVLFTRENPDTVFRPQVNLLANSTPSQNKEKKK